MPGPVRTFLPPTPTPVPPSHSSLHPSIYPSVLQNGLNASQASRTEPSPSLNYITWSPASGHITQRASIKDGLITCLVAQVVASLHEQREIRFW